MQQLVPEYRSLSAAELTGFYAWPDQPWVRSCMVMALDGSTAGPDGLSRSISSDTDRAVFSAIRSGADAYLVGAQTVRAEGYRAVRAPAGTAAARLARGQAAAPTLAIVSGSCRFDWDEADFIHSDNRPIVLTSAIADQAAVAAAARHCEVVVAGDQRVDPVRAVAALAERGLIRVTCEGGQGLLSDVIRAGLLDEVDLTLAPRLAAAPAPARPGVAVLAEMRLATLIDDDGFLLARYLRQE